MQQTSFVYSGVTIKVFPDRAEIMNPQLPAYVAKVCRNAAEAVQEINKAARPNG